ncbi:MULTISPECIES: phage tail tube protein [unclassified Duganella]|jgi:hypothetical protein|uniref:phage tail tube protein n=1 Tax=unclassified Duganella TaxID=2636909 RepID=UPI000881628E|nr:MULTISPECIES: phage tail tube protein [unclassified Duganella]SDH40814.1 hypothetical protein SAMN05216320_1133 [Duganella sp. OV458]SDK61274.1 hypothetical protein SAMN05428973_113160 [Duganella sp. OV510]
MSRIIRNAAILAKLETVYAQDALPSGAANALLVSNQSVNPLNAQNVDRNIIRAYLGNSEQLVGTNYKEVGFDIELVGSGERGVAPLWGPLIRACGFAEVVTVDTRVDYTPISTGYESLTIYYFDDGVLHKLVGARGTASVKMSVGEKPTLTFKFVGKDGGDVVQALPTTDLEEWRIPQVVMDAVSGDLTFGATHTATGVPALTGGVPYPSEGLTLDFGIATPFNALLGGETVPITERKVTGAIKLDLTAAQEIAFLNGVKATELTTIGLQHGTVQGDKTLVFLPSVQRVEPTKEEKNGMRMLGYKLNVNPKNGNDEVRLVTSF